MGTTQQLLHLRAREVAREWLAGAYGDGALRDGGPERTCRGHSQLAGRPTRRRPCCPSAGEVRPECGVEQRADGAGGGEGERAEGERRFGGRLERGRSAAREAGGVQRAPIELTPQRTSLGAPSAQLGTRLLMWTLTIFSQTHRPHTRWEALEQAHPLARRSGGLCDAQARQEPEGPE